MSFSEGIINRTGAQNMLYLTCTSLSSVDLAHYGVSRAQDMVSLDYSTMFVVTLVLTTSAWLVALLLFLFCASKIIQTNVKIDVPLWNSFYNMYQGMEQPRFLIW